MAAPDNQFITNVQPDDIVAEIAKIKILESKPKVWAELLATYENLKICRNSRGSSSRRH